MVKLPHFSVMECLVRDVICSNQILDIRISPFLNPHNTKMKIEIVKKK